MPESPNTHRRSNRRPSEAPPKAQESLRATVRDAARQVETRIIMETLEKHRWNRRRTAEALQISYRSLMYKMKSASLRGGVTPPVSE